MLSKQRAYLRSLAVNIDTIFQIGKGGLTDEISDRVSDALEARELIKLRVLDTSPDSVRNTADELADMTGADVVQIIGSRFILYRRSIKNPRIDLSLK